MDHTLEIDRLERRVAELTEIVVLLAKREGFPRKCIGAVEFESFSIAERLVSPAMTPADVERLDTLLNQVVERGK